MRETGKVAIARVVIRSKEQLVAMRPMGDALGMATMIFADEVHPAERLDEVAEAAQVKTTKRELEIAEQLVGSLAGDFEPEKYRDSYREQVLELIERKAQGQEIAVQPRSRGARRARARPDERAEGEPRGGAGAQARTRRQAAQGAGGKPRARRLRREDAGAKAAAKKPPPRNRGEEARSSRAPPSGRCPAGLRQERRDLRITAVRVARRRAQARRRYPRANATSQRTPEPPAAAGTARPGSGAHGAAPASSSTSTTHAACTGTCAWSTTARSRPGRSPRACPRRPARTSFAAATEDHPLEYLDFEGEIPAGEYGAGTIAIWDRGTYECLKWEPRKVEVRAARRARGRALRAVRRSRRGAARRTG